MCNIRFLTEREVSMEKISADVWTVRTKLVQITTAPNSVQPTISNTAGNHKLGSRARSNFHCGDKQINCEAGRAGSIPHLTEPNQVTVFSVNTFIISPRFTVETLKNSPGLRNKWGCRTGRGPEVVLILNIFGWAVPPGHGTRPVSDPNTRFSFWMALVALIDQFTRFQYSIIVGSRLVDRLFVQIYLVRLVWRVSGVWPNNACWYSSKFTNSVITRAWKATSLKMQAGFFILFLWSKSASTDWLRNNKRKISTRRSRVRIPLPAVWNPRPRSVNNQLSFFVFVCHFKPNCVSVACLKTSWV